jgi:hypothetical protein
VAHDLVGKSVSTFRIMLLTHDFHPSGRKPHLPADGARVTQLILVAHSCCGDRRRTVCGTRFVLNRNEVLRNAALCIGSLRVMSGTLELQKR